MTKKIADVGRLMIGLASILIVELAVLTGLSVEARANDELLVEQNNPANWVLPNGSYSSSRYSTLSQINKDNVSSLGLAWTFSTGVLRGHEGGPLVIGDTLYVNTPFPNIIYALDLDDNGRVIWKYEPKQDPSVIPMLCCDTVNRGVAYADGKIFQYQADTTLAALDAATGEVLWQVKNGDPSKGETGTSAPLVYKDKVYVGVSGGEFGVQGRLSAYEAASGRSMWRAYSSGPDDQTLIDPEFTTHLGMATGRDSGTASWEGDQWKTGGGAPDGWLTVDPELNLIYYGSGAPGTWNPMQRSGDNLWSTTIFARDADTGVAKWVYQMTPHDEWGYDGVNEMILADIPVKGQITKALVHFDRNGFAYTMNRETGELLVAEKYDQAVNWATHIDIDTGRPEIVSRFSTQFNGEDVNTTNICPSHWGVKGQQPATFSFQTGLFYVPTGRTCMDYEPYRVVYTQGQPYRGSNIEVKSAPGSTDLGNFIAWDANKGKIIWSNSEPLSVLSGALATAGGIVFYGTLEGYLKALDAETGRELYRFKTSSGIIGNVNTWMHKGQQYVGVLSGLGGWAGVGLAAGLTDDTAGLGAVGAYKSLSNFTQLGGELVVFSLGGASSDTGSYAGGAGYRSVPIVHPAEPDGTPRRPEAELPPVPKPRIFDLPPYNKREADQRNGAAGAVGEPAVSSSGQLSRSWKEAIADSDAPPLVKSTLLSPDFVSSAETCGQATTELASWRERFAKDDKADLMTALRSMATSEEANAALATFGSYIVNCLSPLSSLEGGLLRNFAQTRVGVLKNAKGLPFCTATLIAPRWIITAYHCLADQSNGRWIDWQATLFAARPGGTEVWVTALVDHVVTTEHYQTASGGARPYNPKHWQDDVVLVELAHAFVDTPAVPWKSLRIGNPVRYDVMAIVYYNVYDAIIRSERVGLAKTQAEWKDSMLVDASAVCMVAGKLADGMLGHVCQTDGGGSGAPLFHNATHDSLVTILGVHAGGVARGVQDERFWNEAGIDTRLVPNIGNAIEERMAARIVDFSTDATP